MTLQTSPIVVADGFTDADGNALRDLAFLAPANELRPAFLFRPPLDGAGFQVRMLWQQLSAVWMSPGLLTRDGSTVTNGIMFTSSGVDLLAPVSAVNRPAGQLWYIFDEGRSGSPGRDDWRQGAKLYYRPVALVAALAGSDRALL